ncbi:hypothetical protein OVA24_05620 [Luteolibacter sp. SL250]|uniref:hypothetical protein n=1 Tax=Luteolibacter sp. SL250 TaxID=2995170 RepID=UPI00227050E2|nr:hypothetical protein [Luteolibacter sp. SL250]WAC20861.1 hypothetical protein OVA24_05620 [Luteolibacter sp. SL250]
MRNYSKLIGALAAVSALAAGNASAIDLSYNLHAGYTSEYIFRGQNLGADLIETGFDVSTEAAGLALSAGAWYGSFDTPGNGSADELDLYGKATKDFGFLEASVGYIWYHNFDRAGVDDAQEVTFGIAKDLGFLTASLTYFWDIETDNDGYAQLDLSKSWELNSCLDLNVGTALGYYAEHGQLAHVTTKVSLDYEFVENAKLTPFAAYTWSLSDDVDTLNAGLENEFVGGAMISVSF